MVSFEFVTIVLVADVVVDDASSHVVVEFMSNLRALSSLELASIDAHLSPSGSDGSLKNKNY